MAASNSAGTNTVSHVVSVGTCTTSSCDTLSNFSQTDTLFVYKVSNGYLSGSSTLTTTTSTTYKAMNIGEFYAKSNFPTNIAQINGAMILFYKNAAANKGTKGSSTLTLSMTGATTGAAGTVPNTVVATTKTLSLSSVVAAPQVSRITYAGNPSLNYGSNYITPFPVMFNSPVNLTGDFFLTLSLPANADTAVVFSNGGLSATNSAAIQYKSGTSTAWYATDAAFGENFSFSIIPIACPNNTTGIESSLLGQHINVFPNPNNGQFNFAVTLSESKNLRFTIVNMLGQAVYQQEEKNVTNQVIQMDLTGMAKGVYFTYILDEENNRTVKKIIIE